MDPLEVVSSPKFQSLIDEFVDEVSGWLKSQDVKQQTQQQYAIRKSFEQD